MEGVLVTMETRLAEIKLTKMTMIEYCFVRAIECAVTVVTGP